MMKISASIFMWWFKRVICALFLDSYIFTGWETILLYIHKIIVTLKLNHVYDFFVYIHIGSQTAPVISYKLQKICQYDNQATENDNTANSRRICIQNCLRCQKISSIIFA
jgi:hypothetical protein